MSIGYRPDLDGLRAIAVVPVVLFHAGIDLFSGGYVGVDIFFVISGFLITSLILKDIRSNRFSLLQFYERRVRRIFPALFVVFAASAIVASLLMLPSELDNFGKSLFAATFFFSNYHFMFDSDYFSAAAETKPLLHMWSLAVEEQYYIFFPPLLFLAIRFLKKGSAVFFLALLLISLGYSDYLIRVAPSDAFYSLPARAWELLLGAMIALYPLKAALNDRAANFFAVTGFGAILFSVFYYSDTTPFPGLAAVVPCAGAALIIISGARNTTWVGRLISTPVFRYPGLVSYSLYLWHWPIIVFYAMYTMTPATNIEIAFLLIMTAVMGWASWRFVESPFRDKRVFSSQRRILVGGAGVMGAAAILGAAIAITDGMPARLSPDIAAVLAAAEDHPNGICQRDKLADNQGESLCVIGQGEATNVTFAVIGDSHGRSLMPAIDVSARAHNLTGVYFGGSGCVPLLGIHQARQGYEHCLSISQGFLDYLTDHPQIETVILASRWAIYAEGKRFRNEHGHSVYLRAHDTKELSLRENKRVFARALEQTLSSLEELGRKIVIVTQVPETEWDIPTTVARSLFLDKEIELRPFNVDYRERQNFVDGLFRESEENYGIALVRPETELCGAVHCSIIQDDVPIYRDSNHLTARFASSLSGLFDTTFSVAARAQQASDSADNSAHLLQPITYGRNRQPL